MSDRQTIQYIDADTGQPFDLETFLEDVDVGTTATKRIKIVNIGIYPIKLHDPTEQGLRILSYPKDWIPSRGSGIMQLAFDVPKEAIIPPEGRWDFKLSIRAGG